MTGRGVAPAPAHDGADARRRVRFAAVAAGGLAAMSAWPIVAFLVVRSSLDGWTEAPIVLGGATLIALLPVAVVLDLFGIAMSDGVTGLLMVAVWLGAWLLPAAWVARRPRARATVLVVVTLQGAFAAAQAGLAAAMILTIDV